MTREEALETLIDNAENGYVDIEEVKLVFAEMQSNSDEDMTVEKYRTRLMEVFHNTDCSELISLVCLPTEEEFENLEYLLKTHYKNKSNSDEDCISREAVLEIAKSSKSNWIDNSVLFKRVNELPPVTPKPKTGHWQNNACSNCGIYNASEYKNWCPNCGCQMTEETDTWEE